MVAHREINWVLPHFVYLRLDASYMRANAFLSRIRWGSRETMMKESADTSKIFTLKYFYINCNIKKGGEFFGGTLQKKLEELFRNSNSTLSPSTGGYGDSKSQLLVFRMNWLNSWVHKEIWVAMARYWHEDFQPIKNISFCFWGYRIDRRFDGFMLKLRPSI